MKMPLGQIYLSQLNTEVEATRKCLEHLTSEVLDFKPTEKSVSFKTLAITVSEIPKWIHSIITEASLWGF